MVGFLYRCAMSSYLLLSFSCDTTPLFLNNSDATHPISFRTVVYPTNTKVMAPFAIAFDFSTAVAWGYSRRDVLSTHQ